MNARVLCFVVCVCAVSQAQAQSTPYAEGRQALVDERFDDAVAQFSQALPNAADGAERWRVLLGLAVAHDLADRPVAAARHYAAFLHASRDSPDAQDGKWRDRRGAARGDLDALDKRVLETHAIVELTSSPTGAALVSPHDPPIAVATPVTLYLTPGSHTVRLQHAGHAEGVHVVETRAGTRVTSHVPLSPLVSDTRPPLPRSKTAPPMPPAVIARGHLEGRPAPQVPARAAPAEGTPWLTPLGAATLSLGGLALIAGVVTTAVAADTVSELDALQAGPNNEQTRARDRELRERLDPLSISQASFYVAGGVLTAGGVAMLIVDGADTTVAVGPTAARLRVRF